MNTSENLSTDSSWCENPSTCLNGGICKDLGNNFTCNCSKGFEGTRCEKGKVKSILDKSWAFVIFMAPVMTISVGCFEDGL